MNKSEKSDSGTETLEVISGAGNFNKWMYETIKPYCSGRVLEIGSGIGNISNFFLEDGFEIVLSDLSPDYFNLLEQQFKDNRNLKGVLSLDFSEPNLKDKYPQLIDQFDTVFALNVLEHVADHEKAIENCYSLLKPGGNLVILVPAFQTLYNQFDTALEHQRRYTKKGLEKVMLIPGFEKINTQFFNVAGILGWFISGKMMGKKMIPGGQMSLYNKLVPLWKLGDWFLGSFFGLSIICVVKKTEYVSEE